MHITHLNSYYCSNRLHEVLVHKLSEVGYRQHVFLPLSKNEKRSEVCVPETTSTIIHCFSELDRKLWPLKIAKIWRAYRRDRARHPTDLNHAHTLFVNGLIAYWAKKAYGTPYVVTIRNTDVNHFLKKHPKIFRRLGLQIMKDADAVLTLSNAYWEQRMPSYYSESELAPIRVKHHTIPNGCEDFWFENLGTKINPGEPIRLLFVGLLNKNKNLHGVLKACHLLRERAADFQLKVVGSGPLEAALRREAVDLPVQFLGYVNDRERLLEIYRDSDLLIVPSFTESFGVVYAEAMTQGLPVVYTAGQGFDGFFPDGRVGYAVDPNDAVQIASCMIKIKHDYPNFASAVASNAAKFQWCHSVSALNKVYEEASGGQLGKTL